jgi:hypothetical protein
MDKVCTSCVVFPKKWLRSKYIFIYTNVLTSMIRSVRNCFLLWCFLITSKVLLLYYNYVYICTRYVPYPVSEILTLKSPKIVIFNMSWSLDLFFNRSATQKNQMIMRFHLGLDITFLLPFFIEFTIDACKATYVRPQSSY